MNLPWFARSYPVGAYIATMAAGIVVPIIVFGVLLLTALERRERLALENRAIETAKSISVNVDRRLSDMATTLRLIATSLELQTGDLQGLHKRTQAALAGGDWYVLAVDRNGQQLINTRVDFGEPLGKTSNMEALQQALASGDVTLSGAFFGKTSQKWVFNLIDPIPETATSAVAALILTQNASELSGAVDPVPLPAEWSAAIVDQFGKVIAASTDSAGVPGEPLEADLLAILGSADGPIQLAIGGQEGVATVGATAWGGWKTIIWGPVSSAQRSILASWRMLLLGGAALALLIALFGYLLASKLQRAVHQLSAMATELSNGGIVSPAQTGIRELDDVAVALTEASYDRAMSQQKLMLIMRELVHRTKNMLTVIQSMMRQTARDKPSVDAFLPAISDRIVGLAQSIDLLTAADWGGVSLRDLIRKQLAPFVTGSDRVSLQGDDLLLNAEAVQNLGLVLHELGTNAVKYGALSNVTGTVEISWQRYRDGERDSFHIVWTERGGPMVRGSGRKGFGTSVVTAHAQSAFRGTVTMDHVDDGLRWELHAPWDAFEWDAPSQTSWMSSDGYGGPPPKW